MAKIDGFINELKKYVDKYRSWKRRVFLAKSSYYKHLIGYRIKSISFKTRREKIREFDDLNKANPEIYFTTDLVKTGFTDQLIGFSFLYKLGKGLGLKYHHTRLSSHRSTVPFLFYPYSKEKLPDEDQSDVFDFLGLNSFLSKQFAQGLIDNFDDVRINLEATLLRNGRINSAESLVDEMKIILRPYMKRNRSLLLIFECAPATYFKYFAYVALQTEHELNFRKIFDQQKRELPLQSKFKENTIKVMVHIRQGDTGTIKTPWNTFIPTWYMADGKYTQFKNREDIPSHLLIDVIDFYGFLKDLLSTVEDLPFSTVLYSDGFKKTFRAIYQSYKSAHISKHEIEKLREIEEEYDEMEFGRFRNLQGVEAVVGEDVEKLYDLIHSFMEANVLIFGTHGTMIPKFLATYADKTNMPLMICLYKAHKPYMGHLGFDNSADYLLYVNLYDYDVKKISRKIEEYLSKRNSVN